MRVSKYLCLALLLVLAVLAPARAQQAAPSAGDEPSAAPVRVEGRRLFDVTASGEATASQRAARISRRLGQLVEREEAVPPFTPRDVLSQNGEQVVTLGGEKIMTITGRGCRGRAR
jgi:hypothetical protein